MKTDEEWMKIGMSKTKVSLDDKEYPICWIHKKYVLNKYDVMFCNEKEESKTIVFLTKEEFESPSLTTDEEVALYALKKHREKESKRSRNENTK